MASITGKAPVTWEDWRRLYRAEIYGMGLCAFTYFHRLFDPDHKRLMPKVILERTARSAWRHWHRLSRIERRMEEARERNCPTYLAAMYDHIISTGEPETED